MSKQYGFFVDTSRCIKCWACEVSCKQWNGIKAGTTKRRWVEEIDEGTFPEVNRRFVTTACNHCEDAACVAACPAGAISKRDEDGMVVVDKSLCIGCQTCTTACPYGVPDYESDTGKMDKCDGCVGVGRTPDEVPQPHCVATCPTKALMWGTLEELAEQATEKGGSRVEGETNPSLFML